MKETRMSPEKVAPNQKNLQDMKISQALRILPVDPENKDLGNFEFIHVGFPELNAYIQSLGKLHTNKYMSNYFIGPPFFT